MSERFLGNQVDPGYYDEVLLNGLKKKFGIQSNWHNLTFLKIAKKLILIKSFRLCLWSWNIYRKLFKIRISWC